MLSKGQFENIMAGVSFRPHHDWETLGSQATGEQFQKPEWVHDWFSLHNQGRRGAALIEETGEMLPATHYRSGNDEIGYWGQNLHIAGEDPTKGFDIGWDDQDESKARVLGMEHSSNEFVRGVQVERSEVGAYLNKLRGEEGLMAIDRRPDESENRAPDFERWLAFGKKMGYCSDPVCGTHDGYALTEGEEYAFEAGGDPCVPVVRLQPAEGLELDEAEEMYG